MNTGTGGNEPVDEETHRSRSHDGDSTVRALYTDLELTRAELGDTIAALVDKVDLKSRAQDYAHDHADRLAEATHTARQGARRRVAWLARHRGGIAIASVALGVFAAGVLARRRRTPSVVHCGPKGRRSVSS